MSTKQEKLKRISEVLGMVIEDMETDVKEFNGKPFTGKTLGELHGTLAATIQAVAKATKYLVDEELAE